MHDAKVAQNALQDRQTIGPRTTKFGWLLLLGFECRMDSRRLTISLFCITIFLLYNTCPCLAGYMKWMQKAMKKYADNGPSTKFLGVKGIFIPVPLPIPIDLKKMMMKW
ncbi:hypothetical protein AVEN_75297-1 [Araneus ventricosus]|uniref:Uncharacterized protein n=1 Tax=Araneus ventricosus TaxID=182803 RepID=A0A4Y2G2D6_ARAVE|nr:hypothetical protein AVEN_75297-1 [Araneus ventricosus]